MTTITCGLCRKQFDSGPEHCPYCHLRVPGAPLRPAPKKPSAPLRRPARRTPDSSRPPKPAGQCPACSHDITTADTWCKWCHWPVNR